MGTTARLIVMDETGTPIRFYADGVVESIERRCKASAPMDDSRPVAGLRAASYEIDPVLPCDDDTAEADPRIVKRVDGKWIRDEDYAAGDTLTRKRDEAIQAIANDEYAEKIAGFEFDGRQFSCIDRNGALDPHLLDMEQHPKRWIGYSVMAVDGGVYALETADEVAAYAAACLDSYAALTCRYRKRGVDVLVAASAEAVAALRTG